VVWRSRRPAALRPFEGGRYRVFATDGETNSCDGNELLSTGHGTGGDRTRICWGATALVLLAVAGGLTWLVRRS
jgi:hypothetical protein